MQLRKKTALALLLVFVLAFVSGCGDKPANPSPTAAENPKPIQPIKVDASEDPHETVKEMIKELTLEQKVGQLLMPDFRKWDGQNVTVINDDIRKVIRDYHLGGVILFRENLVDRGQTKLLIDSMQKEAEIPLLIGVDQEGGLVTRLSFAPQMPGNMALGATGKPELARQVGTAIGSELKRLGFNVNFGPDLDINNNPDNPVIGVRSFGDNADIVSELGLQYTQGLNAAGIAAVGKHFPGHGDVDMDSHYALPKNSKTYDQLKQLELIPFKHLINEGIQAIMTAHITFDSIETQEVKSKKDGLPVILPATLSKKIQTDILRKDLGFDGILFTDAMDMQAISDHFGPVDAAIKAIEAGNDIVLMPVDVKSVYEGILDAVKSEKLSEKRIDESVERILLLKLQFAYPNEEKSYEQIDAVQALAIEQTVADASITVVDNDGIIPLQEDKDEVILLAATNNSDLKRLEAAVKPHNWRAKTVLLSSSANALGNLTSEQLKAFKTADKVIVSTNMLNAKDKEWQLKTMQSILKLDIPTIIIAARNPYGLKQLEGYEAFIAQYSNSTPSFNATGNVLFGKLDPQGKLPVQLR